MVHIFQNIILGILLFASLPILLSWMLRAIAGKHAIDVYPEDSAEEIAARKRHENERRRYAREITDGLR